MWALRRTITPVNVPQPWRQLISITASIAAAVLAASPVLAHGEEAPAPELPGVLLAWRLDPIPLVGVVMAAAAFLWAVRQVAGRHPANPPRPWRTAAFLAGLAVIAVALVVARYL